LAAGAVRARVDDRRRRRASPPSHRGGRNIGGFGAKVNVALGNRSRAFRRPSAAPNGGGWPRAFLLGAARPRMDGPQLAMTSMASSGDHGAYRRASNVPERRHLIHMVYSNVNSVYSAGWVRLEVIEN
jgi:hypothetical protein